jgi:hypothetical protein
MGDQVRHRDQRYAVPPGDLGELRPAGHRPVRGEDLADDPGGGETGRPGEIHRGLGVPVAFQRAVPAAFRQRPAVRAPGERERG